MTNRRRFLALLGVGTASVPLAAKQAIEAEQMKLAGISGGIGSGRGGVEYVDDDDFKSSEAAVNYAKLFGVPSHVERRAREHARHIRSLDPDIACKRSWSLCVKIQEQRQRNYDSAMAYYRDLNSYGRAQAAFEKISGFKWPW